MSPVSSLKSMQIDSASRLHDSLCKLGLVITWQTQFPPWLKLMLCCPQEFIRVGYYVNNEYMEEELRETPPEKAQIDRSDSHQCSRSTHPLALLPMRLIRHAIAPDCACGCNVLACCLAHFGSLCL